MQPATGLVYVKNGTLLDREGRSLYTATLQASDTDGKAGTTLLEITLTDVNDEHPVINRETYFEFVAEGQPFEMVIQVSSKVSTLKQTKFPIYWGTWQNVNYTGCVTEGGELNVLLSSSNT